MLLISITMFVRKKTKIAFAYGVLAASALSVTTYDACLRSAPPRHRTQAGRFDAAEPALPLGITPIAESPFPEARPGNFDVSGSVLTQVPNRTKHTPPSGVYFLTVALQVDSAEGTVAFHRGTRVRLIRQQDGKLLVTRNGTDFLVEKSQVTDDLNALASLAGSSS